jgi:subtilase family serine protease
VTSFIASLSDRSSTNFRRFLRPGQFGRLFGPSPSEVAAVEASLRTAGLDPGPVTSNRLMIPVTAPASSVNRAFHVNLLRYRLASGRTVFTSLSPPSIASAVSADIEGVLGLNDLVQPHSLLVRPSVPPAATRRASSRLQPDTAGPSPCNGAIAAAETVGSNTADRLASYYGMTPLYSLGDFGQGVHIALVEFEPNLPSDINVYKACYNLHTTVDYIKIDGGSGTGPGSGEAALDIEDVIGLAPRATIDVYQGAAESTSSDILDVYSAIMTAETDQIISTGWGVCELDTAESDGGSALLSSEQTLFKQAATQGQTIFAASGDTGSTDCLGDSGTTNGKALSVDDPSSQPYVIGVGGTTMGANSENVWNDSITQNGAGGGGVSSIWCMPSYQTQTTTVGKSDVPGLINSDSVLASALTGTSCPASTYMREVPDVSADADPDTGYTVYWTPDTPGAHGAWRGGEAGTSAAAPLWAAVAALVDASPFCKDYTSTDLSKGGISSQDATGLLFNTIYTIAASQYYYPLAFYDVTHGSNFYSPSGSTDDVYAATKGYDMASGLGTPTVAYPGNFYPGLAALVCGLTATTLTTTMITRVVPDLGPSNRTTMVTISGTGFLPIKGADMLKVGSKLITLSCESSTRCTGTLPATKAGTDDLRVLVEDLTANTVAKSDQFTFAGVPTVTRVRPLRGPAKGGSLVTIHGTGFLGSLRVRFGAKWATQVHVYSPGRLTVRAPSGTGTVDIYVTALGGTSKKTPVGTYRYAPVMTKAHLVAQKAG